MRKRRGKDAEQAADMARHDAEIVDRPAQRPRREPEQPKAGGERERAGQRVADAVAVLSDAGRSGFGNGTGDLHGQTVGATAARTSQPAGFSRAGNRRLATIDTAMSAPTTPSATPIGTLYQSTISIFVPMKTSTAASP